jgi:16S rRNA (cytidine1402-2'-O)-methyltransferase
MLYIVATPIGNSEDITLRALRILGEVDFILAEDTRKTGMLLKKWGATNKLISFFEHNETRKTPWVIEELKQGKSIALVSSAGAPTLSDPGYKLVRECRKEALPITSLPGPSSIINALCLTSLGHEKFSFLGYMPRKQSERRKLLGRTKDWGLAIVFFESPFRLIKTLNDIKDTLGNRRVAIAREMTKKFEEILELEVEEAIAYFEKKKPKGEFVIVLDREPT